MEIEKPSMVEAKPKKHKSRNGCLTCKKKRLKCDESKPFCINCTKKKIQCGGYATAFKWKSFQSSGVDKFSDDQSNQIQNRNTNPSIQSKNSNKNPNHTYNDRKTSMDESVLQRHLEAASISMTGKNLKQIKLANDLILQGKNPDYDNQTHIPNHSRTKSNDSMKMFQKNGLDNIDSVDHIKYLRNQFNLSSTAVIEKEIKNGGTVEIFSRKPISPSEILNEQSPLSDDQGQIEEAEVEDEETAHEIGQNVEYSSLNSLANLATQIKNSPHFPQFSPSPDFYSTSSTNSPKLIYNKNQQQNQNQTLNNFAFSPSFSALVSSSQFNDFLNQISSPRLTEKIKSSSNSTPPSIFSNMKNSPTTTTTNTPSLSTLISAFTDFDNMDGLAAPSPFDLKDRENCGKVEEKDEEEETTESLDENINERQIMRHDISPSQSNNSSPMFTINLPMEIPLNEQERILKSFDTHTCGIMSIKNGPTENPWRSFILPLSQKFPVVYYSVAAMTCFHVARGDNDIRALGLKNMKLAIMELAKGLSTNSLPHDVALITCLALAVSECWDRHISTGIAHLRGARSMILKVLQNFKTKNITGGSTDENDLKQFGNYQTKKLPKDLQFLFNVWVYFDVLARMTSDSNHEENSMTDSIQTDTPIEDDDETRKKRKSNMGTPMNMNGDTTPKARARPRRKSINLIDQFEFNIENEEVDPLLGCAQSLFPIMGKIASLISIVRKNETRKNSLSIISKAAELRKKLTDWKTIPSIKMTQVEDSAWDLSSCIATAEAYRYSTLLYLHQAVPEIPSLSSHQIAEKILMLLASIPVSSRTSITHIFPLLAASCEATPGEEREWCLERWQVLAQMMGIGNIDRAIEVVKEVWSRKDTLKKRRKPSSNLSVDEDGKLKDIALQISGLMAAVNGDTNFGDGAEEDRIQSWAHWTTVMKDWGWEVLLG